MNEFAKLEGLETGDYGWRSLWSLETMKGVMLTDHFFTTQRTTLKVSSLSNDGVASVSRIDKIIGLFCKRAL